MPIILCNSPPLCKTQKVRSSPSGCIPSRIGTSILARFTGRAQGGPQEKNRFWILLPELPLRSIYRLHLRYAPAGRTPYAVVVRGTVRLYLSTAVPAPQCTVVAGVLDLGGGRGYPSSTQPFPAQPYARHGCLLLQAADAGSWQPRSACRAAANHWSVLPVLLPHSDCAEQPNVCAIC
jgi:hypothetical protein